MWNEKLREQPGDVVIEDIADYIDASIAAEQSRVMWRRIGVAALGLVAIVMAGLAGFAWLQEQETIQQTRAGALAAAGYARKFSDEGKCPRRRPGGAGRHSHEPAR
jgi:hypothetical protein